MNHTTGLYKYIPIPNEYKPDIYSIDYENLKKLGFTTILFDYDFTITIWKDKKITSKTLELFERLLNMEFKVAIVTNSKEERVSYLRNLLDGKIKVFSKMKKPNTKKLKTVLEKLDAKPKNTVMVGDLFITDVAAGNKLGIYTFLINPYTYGVTSFFKKFMAGFSKFSHGLFFYTFGWFFRLMDISIPNDFKKDVISIDYEFFSKKNYKLVIFDFDNTLVPWHSSKLTSEVKEMFIKIKDLGMKPIICTNGKDSRFDLVKKDLYELEVDIQTLCLKPLTHRILKKIKKYNIKSNECVLIGDQLFTDISAGNLCNFYTIKVEPISTKEGKWTKIMRHLEKFSLKIRRKKPKL